MLDLAFDGVRDAVVAILLNFIIISGGLEFTVGRLLGIEHFWLMVCGRA